MGSTVKVTLNLLYIVFIRPAQIHKAFSASVKYGPFLSDFYHPDVFVTWQQCIPKSEIKMDG